MTTPTDAVQRFVDAFVSAWPTADAARVAALFTEDASYHNGPLEPVHGRDAIEATLREFMAMGGEVAVDMVHMLAGDQVVMTERIDHFVIGGETFSLPVMGVFEIDNGQIRAWRDYFDPAQFTSLLSETQ
jgi:limonene-1,2-epoxide hydrolase